MWVRNGDDYQAASVVSGFASAFGVSGGEASAYKMTVDIFFYLGIVALIAGVIMLIANKKKSAV